MNESQKTTTLPPTIAVVGDMLLDEYLMGTQSYSLNEGVPSFHFSERRFSPGGAANVAMNLAAQGYRVYLIGVVGDDQAGRRLLELLPPSINKDFVSADRSFATIVKRRAVDSNLRIIMKLEQSETPPLNKVNKYALLESVTEVCQHVSTMVVSDYGYGVVEDELVKRLAAMKRLRALLVDPRGQRVDKYQGAGVLTPNQEEFYQLINRKCSNINDTIDEARKLIRNHKIGSIVLKHGGQGSWLVTADYVYRMPPLYTGDIKSAVGAGDALIASMAGVLSAGNSLVEAFTVGNAAAACVLSDAYTTVVSTKQIHDMMHAVNPEQFLQRCMVPTGL